MFRKLVIDQNVIINLILNRVFTDNSVQVLLAVLKSKEAQGYVTSGCWHDVLKVLTDLNVNYQESKVFSTLFLNLSVLDDDPSILNKVKNSPLKNPRDAMYQAHLESVRADAVLVTSNSKRFNEYGYRAVSVKEFVNKIKKTELNTDSLIKDLEKGLNYQEFISPDFHVGNLIFQDLKVHLVGLNVSRAEVFFKEKSGAVLRSEAEGVGAIDAAFKAIDEIIPKPRRRVFSFNASSSSSEGNVTTFLGIFVEDISLSFTSFATHPDTVRASVGAYLSAINQALEYFDNLTLS